MPGTEDAWVVPRDFSTRPEIITALTGARAVGTRTSETLRTELLYVAIPVASGGTVYGAIRLTLDTNDIDSHIHRFWGGLAGVAAVILAAMTLAGMAIAGSMTRPIRRLQKKAARFASGDLTVEDAPTEGPAELQALNQTMSTMAVRLAALLEEQRAFVAETSHQLRRPLTALRLRLENLQSHAATEDATDLETAIDETVRLGALVNDLLQLARADQPPPNDIADLADITANRIDTWSAIADTKQIRLQLTGTEQPTIVHTVAGAIEQIPDNTLDKARALHRFWRGASNTPGTGLGLPIAAALATASRGSLTLTDAADHGLAVTLNLPAAANDRSHPP